MQKRISGGGPMPRTLKELLNTFFLTLQKKTLLSTEVLDICTRAGPKTLPKKVQKNSNGPRRGTTPGRLGAQNRWFLKGSWPEGRFHRTYRWDRPGALAPRRAAQSKPQVITTIIVTIVSIITYCLYSAHTTQHFPGNFLSNLVLFSEQPCALAPSYRSDE